MRALLIFFGSLLCTSLHATPPEHFSSRKWVEQRCITNATPKDERLFVGGFFPHEYARILRYQKGITLREIVDRTPSKGLTVVVCVLRPKVDPVTNIIKVKPTEMPNFVVNAQDMIWIYEDGPLVW
jgi:hypothetical protein